MSSKWVGAGDLKPGDELKEADGGVGVVLNVLTVAQTRIMYNLTVDSAHTFYVGEQGWLAHNAGGNPPIDPKTDLPLVRDPISGLLKPQPPLAPLFSGQPDLTEHVRFRLDVTNRQLSAAQQWDILTSGTPHYDTDTGNFVYTKGNKAVLISGDGQRVVTVLDNISSSNQVKRGAIEKWLPTKFNPCE
ncbi:polymorphic toxin-type HINT domain-containing protein [Deinococcus sp.]|uniref:polymorphic toxin-type HINT domain-containing protein n=1 Tax=Deinococcus sp. TaxID=47478 RepID=UPI003CC543C8